MLNDKFSELIKDQIGESFVEKYQKKAKETEGVGLLVSHYFKWDGRQIVEAFCEALTDANFHSLRDKVEEEFEKYLKEGR